MEPLAGSLLPLIEAHRGRVGVAVKHLDTGASWAVRGDEVFPTASLIKVAVLVEVYMQELEGRLSLDERLTLTEEDKVPGSGILSKMQAGLSLTVRDAATLMMVLSDNTATNLLLDRVDLGAPTARMERWGLPNTKIHSKVYRRDTSLWPERSERYGLGSTTPNEMVTLLERLHRGAAGSPAASAAMIALMKQCEDLTKLRRFLPPEAELAHKGGAVEASRCDAGLLYLPRTCVAVAVLTTDNQDRSWRIDNEAQVLIAEIGRRVYQYFEALVP